jgi:hypothetical protein
MGKIGFVRTELTMIRDRSIFKSQMPNGECQMRFEFEESFSGRSAAFKPQQAPNFTQAAKTQGVQ